MDPAKYAAAAVQDYLLNQGFVIGSKAWKKVVKGTIKVLKSREIVCFHGAERSASNADYHASKV